MSSFEKPISVIKHLPSTIEKMLEKAEDPLKDLTTMLRNGVIISAGMEGERFRALRKALTKRGTIEIIPRDGRRYYAAA